MFCVRDSEEYVTLDMERIPESGSDNENPSKKSKEAADKKKTTIAERREEARKKRSETARTMQLREILEKEAATFEDLVRCRLMEIDRLKDEVKDLQRRADNKRMEARRLREIMEAKGR